MMKRKPSIKLFELGPTRSARCRWTLLEAGLEYESIGNRPDIIGSEELRKVHPLGKLPAAIIDGRPLFESAAISTAIADLVPEKDLVAKPGTWSRALHDQWVCFALTEMEPWVSSTELNSLRKLPQTVDSMNWTFLAGFYAGGKSDEEVTVHRVADGGDSEGRGSRGAGGTAHAQARDQCGDLLPLEIE